MKYVIFCLIFSMTLILTPKAWAQDLGTVEHGDVIWIDDMPCEVCVSKAFVLHAAEHKKDAEQLRPALIESDRRLVACTAENTQLKNRPGFWTGAAWGFGAGTFFTLLTLFVATR